DFQHHRRALAGGVIVLLDAVYDALAGRIVDDALAADGVGDRTALRRVLAFGLDRDGIAAEDVEFPLRKRLLVELSAFGGWRDRVKHAAVCDPGFRVVGD